MTGQASITARAATSGSNCDVQVNIKCMQINLQHSRSATANLMHLIMQCNVDIVFIQEPYCLLNKVAGISGTYRVFFWGNMRKRAAIILCNKSIDAVMLSQISDEDSVVVELVKGSLRFCAVSMYLDITEDINIDLSKIDAMLSFSEGTDLLIAMDSNARSSMWHDTITNNRGRDLEDYLSAHGLFVMNENRDITTFENSRGRSNVDLTIITGHLMPMLHQWMCGEEESCSDHKIITFSIGKYTLQDNGNIVGGMKFIVKDDRLADFGEQVVKGSFKNI